MKLTGRASTDMRTPRMEQCVNNSTEISLSALLEVR